MAQFAEVCSSVDQRGKSLLCNAVMLDSSMHGLDMYNLAYISTRHVCCVFDSLIPASFTFPHKNIGFVGWQGRPVYEQKSEWGKQLPFS